MLKDSLFYAKILLFGEYGIIQDSMGLSIPYNFYRGRFSTDQSGVGTHSNNELQKYCDHLSLLKDNGELLADIDVAKFQQDIEDGLTFDSTIPQGYGVGSSGALVAAIYHRYGIVSIDGENTSKEDIVRLKTIFGQMESYFHGKSSGLDPLICYLNLPVLIKSKTEVDAVGLPSETVDGKGAIFLINSGTPGETQPMVQIFLEKMKETGFRNMLKQEFKKYNDACIKAFLKKDLNPLFSNLKKLSTLLLENFSPMIPGSFHELWKQGIDSGDFYLKLCGSGGGGYVLGFTRDFDKTKEVLKNYDLEVVYSF
jgi:mevalonate kinase